MSLDKRKTLILIGYRALYHLVRISLTKDATRPSCLKLTEIFRWNWHYDRWERASELKPRILTSYECFDVFEVFVF